MSNQDEQNVNASKPEVEDANIFNESVVVQTSELNSIEAEIPSIPLSEAPTDLAQDVNLSKADVNKFQIVDKIYQYQSHSKLDRLPTWSRILISIVLIIILIGLVVGGAFAIKAVNDKNRQSQPELQSSLVITTSNDNHLTHI
ncbi:hypothetical protein [[Mycoplasma] testudinis]|uniref:hypothetical protein n=1 Tax=[Mycoplasma] testudinis TaxID=33924 RepID=UPI000560B520|nr:hypothetical protein [[Mycoplasma] testudinis]